MALNNAAQPSTAGGRTRTGQVWAKASLVLLIVVVSQLLFDYKNVRGTSPRGISEQPHYSSSSAFVAEKSQCLFVADGMG